MNTTTETKYDKRTKDFYYDTLAAFGAYFPTEEENIGERIADFCGLRFYIDRITESENRMDSIPFEEEKNENGVIPFDKEPSSCLEVKPFEFIQLLTRLYDSYHYQGQEWMNLESRAEEIKKHIFKKCYLDKYGYSTVHSTAEKQLPARDIIEYRIHSLLNEVDQEWDTYALNMDCCNMKYQHHSLDCEFASDNEQYSYCGRFLEETSEGKPMVHQFHTLYTTDMEEEMNYLNQICNYQNLNTDRVTLKYNYSDGGDNSLSFSQLDGYLNSTIKYDLTNEMVTTSQSFKNRETTASHKATMEDKYVICQMLEKFVKEKQMVEYNDRIKGLKK